MLPSLCEFMVTYKILIPSMQHPFFLKVWWRKCFSTESLLKKHSSIIVLRKKKRRAYLSSLCGKNEVSAFLELSGNHNLTCVKLCQKIILRLLRNIVWLSFSLSVIQVCRFKRSSQTKARVWSICSKWSVSSVLVWQLDKRKSVSITDSFWNVE